MFVNIDRYGNTSAASVPIALAEAADEGRLRDGDLVLLSGLRGGHVVGQRRPPLGAGPLMGGRVALVTGASRGIGRAVAVALAADGHRVAACYGSDAAAGGGDVRRPSRALGGEALAVQVDVSRPESVDAAFAQVEEAWGKVEVLVSNAGINRDGLLMRMADDQWAEVLRTNLDGAFHVVRRATPGMVRARWGRIVARRLGGRPLAARPARPTTRRPRPAWSASPAPSPASSAPGTSPPTWWRPGPSSPP